MTIWRECYEYPVKDRLPYIHSVNIQSASIGDRIVIGGENLIPDAENVSGSTYLSTRKTLTLMDSTGRIFYIDNTEDGEFVEFDDGYLRGSRFESFHGQKMSFVLKKEYCAQRVALEAGHTCPKTLQIQPGIYKLQVRYWGGLQSNEVGLEIR